MDALDPADVILQAMGVHPSGRPQLDVLEALESAAERFRDKGQFFNAGYAMEMGIHPAWGDGAAIRRCVEQAFADYERVVAATPGGSFTSVAGLERWSTLLRMNYLEDDRTEVRRSQLALDHVLAEHLIELSKDAELVPERCAVLIRGFRLRTDLRADWLADFPPVEVTRGVTRSVGTLITFHVPSAFGVLVGIGDYDAAQALANACPESFAGHGLRGWRAAVCGFTDPSQAVEHFSEAADEFGLDVYTGDPGPMGWSSVNVDLWAKYFRARSVVAKIVRAPDLAAELVAAGSALLAGTESGWMNPQVTCFRIVLDVVDQLFREIYGELAVEPREELLRAARFSGLDESSAQALLFIDEIADAFRELRENPDDALTSGTLARALRTLARIPLVGPEVARALSPAVGARARDALLGQHLTWIYQALEGIRNESDLRRVLLRLFQADPPLRRGRLQWPHRGRLKWPHFASVVVGVDVA